MSTNLTFDDELIYRFLIDRGVELMRSAGQQGIGLERDGELIGAIMYENFSGTNVWMHVAGVAGKQWINRLLLKAAFKYPFVQLGCNRVSGWVDASNLKARRLDEHLGLKQEAILEGAAKDGGDVIIYRMKKEECRFL